MAPDSGPAGTLHSAAMASLLSGIVLVIALAVAATAGIALVVAFFRVTGRRPAAVAGDQGPQPAAEPPTWVS